ncbi:MAG: tetraacyldisaccharide 4'-kinase [Bryobacteraceae bacterium]
MTASFIYFLYRLSQWLLFPFLLAYAAFRCIENPAWRAHFAERLGFVPPAVDVVTPTEAVWLHAVSVGEVVSAVPFIRELQRRLPGVRVFVSVGTVAGRELAEARLHDLAAQVFYLPFDFVFALRRVLRQIRPTVLVVMETEIWPNLWRESARAGAKVLVVNGRISDKAFARYRPLAPLLGSVLAIPERILVQTEIARKRFVALGAPDEKVVHGGNLKYDFSAGDNHPAPDLAAWITAQPATKVWIAASTMPPRQPSDPDEDDVVIDAFEAIAPRFPKLLLVLVPRKPERFDAAAARLAARGIPFTRRTALFPGSAPPRLPSVLLLDTIGELAALFRLAHVVFMGGTLVDRGGHNLLEPAFFEAPVISGKHLENFPEIASEFRAAEAFVEIDSPSALAPAAAGLLADPTRAKIIGARAGKIAHANAGAAARAAAEALRLLDLSVPAPPPPLWRRLALEPFSWIWRAGVALDRAVSRKHRLPRPVISVGGLSMGGSGKTPFAIFAAWMLRRAGKEPAILTRGYRRESTDGVVLQPGEPFDSAATGDEAALLLLSMAGPVAIGADRAALARRILAANPSENIVFLLDDGFQHWPLHRDNDVVLIDTLDPLAGGLFPLGRLRETPSAMRRATAVVLTRCRPGRSYTGLRELIRGLNPKIPVFLSSIVPLAWVHAETGQRAAPDSLRGEPALAFCGLGNPAAFRLSLAETGIGVAAWRVFPDHHRYSSQELEALAQAARLNDAPRLVTTAKDVANLPSGWLAHFDGLELLWLDVELRVENDESLQNLLLY